MRHGNCTGRVLYVSRRRGTPRGGRHLLAKRVSLSCSARRSTCTLIHAPSISIDLARIPRAYAPPLHCQEYIPDVNCPPPLLVSFPTSRCISPAFPPWRGSRRYLLPLMSRIFLHRPGRKRKQHDAFCRYFRTREHAIIARVALLR